MVSLAELAGNHEIRFCQERPGPALRDKIFLFNHIQKVLIFNYINILTGGSEVEMLAGELFQGILVVRKQLDFPFHPVDFLLVGLYLAVLALDFKTGLHPAENTVGGNEPEENGKRRGDYHGILPERIMVAVPDGMFHECKNTE
jgi:hypothetical protein